MQGLSCSFKHSRKHARNDLFHWRCVTAAGAFFVSRGKATVMVASVYRPAIGSPALDITHQGDSVTGRYQIVV